MANLTQTANRFALGPFDSDKRYLREVANVADAEMRSPVGETTETVNLANGYIGWSFKSGAHTMSYNGPTVSNTYINIGV